jgi:hypothetical protein
VKPFRIRIETDCIVSREKLQEQAKIQAHRPRVAPVSPHGRKLAVVGAGPELVRDLDALREWDGDIWAINSAGRFLAQHGIRSIFVSIDPLLFPYRLDWVEEALIATCCHPGIFEQLEGKPLRVFELIETAEDGITGGCVTATRMPSLAMRLGYLDVSFFGCEGSYPFDGNDHVDYHNGEAQELVVRAGGQDYRIETGLLVQCEQLALLFGVFPNVFKNRSRGLLAAMIEHPDTWEVVAVSAAMKAHLEEVNGKLGMYEIPYAPAA